MEEQSNKTVESAVLDKKSFFIDLFSSSNLFWVFVAGIFSLFLWNIPYISFLLYPFKIFVTFVHEASHGIAALITGGHFYKLFIEFDTSGLAYTGGGWRFLVISAGYLGSAIVGGFLFLAAFRKGWEKIILLVLGSLFLLFTVLFARNFVAIISGLVFGAGLIALTKYPNNLISLFIGVLGIQSSFYAFKDILLLFSIDNTVKTDALTMSQEIAHGLLHPSFFALIWLMVSIIIFIFFLQIIQNYLFESKKQTQSQE